MVDRSRSSLGQPRLSWRSIGKTWGRREYALGVLGLSTAIAYVPWWNGSAIAPKWCVMAIGSAVLIAVIAKAPPLTKANVIGTALLCYSFISALWSPVWHDAADSSAKLAILGLVFAVGARVPSLLPAYIGFGAAMCVNSGYMVWQRVWYTAFESGDSIGLFFNPTLSGEAAVLVIAALIGSNWPLVIGAWPSLVLSGSRAAVAAFALTVTIWLWQQDRQKLAWLTVLSLPLLFAVGLLWGKPLPQTGERLDIWRDILSGLLPFGHGIGSLWTTFPSYAHYQDILHSRPEHAHNDYLELIYELGIGAGLAFWLAIHLYRCAAATERRILAAFAVLSLVGFPLYMPASAFLLAIVAGHASRSSPELRFAVVLRRERILKRA